MSRPGGWLESRKSDPTTEAIESPVGRWTATGHCLVSFPAQKSKNFVSRARNTPLRSVFLSAWEAKVSWSCPARPAAACPSAFEFSGPRNTWECLQAQENALEVPERAVVLGGDRFLGGWGFQRVLPERGVGIIGAWFAAGIRIYSQSLACHRTPEAFRQRPIE